MKFFKNVLALSLICVLSLSMVACKKATPKETELTKITLAEVTHSVFYAPQYVALSLGYFEEEGLSIDLITTQGADKTMAAVISNQAQIGLMGPEATIYVYNQGKDDYVINFAQLTQKDGSFIVSREKIDNFTYDMLRGKSILGGRKGGVPEMTLEYVLKRNGLDAKPDDPNAEVNVRTDIQFGVMAGAFTAGEGDFTTLFEPVASAIEKEGKGFVVASVGQDSGLIPYTTYSAPKSYIDNNPDIIQKFTNAVYKGQLYVQSHTDEEVAKAVQPFFPDLALEDLTKVVNRYKSIDAWSHTPILTQDSLDKLMDVMALANQLEKRAPYDIIVNNDFGNKAVENIK